MTVNFEEVRADLSDDMPLYVARPLLPEIGDFIKIASTLWRSRMLTNGGVFHNQLEAELRRYLGVPVGKLFVNGTIGLMCALRALDLPEGSEVITTPLTFAATAHAIAFCGFKPVFADVLGDELTLDPAAVESAVTSKTAAVLGVHVYGTICDVAGLQHVCDKHGLKLIFDAAHAFGAELNGNPVGIFGDLSVFSFHATKLYHTFEGGFITSPNPALARRLGLIRNFGIVDETAVESVGINGKMSELHSAIGLINLPLVDAERRSRRKLRCKYNEIIADINGVRHQSQREGEVLSEQYYPIVVDQKVYGRSREDIYQELKSQGVFARRYFWPICTDFEPYKGMAVHSACGNVPRVELLKNQMLCLPFHSSVSQKHVDIIAATLRSTV